MEYRIKKLLEINFQMLSIIFFVFVNVLVPRLSNAQSSLSTSDILASAKQQYVLELQCTLNDFLR